jgi:hypothetical protein
VCVDGVRVDASPLMSTDKGLVYQERTGLVVQMPWSRIQETRARGKSGGPIDGRPCPTPKA